MARVKVKMNRAGAMALLTSQGVAGDIEARATAICESANSKASPDEMEKRPYGSMAHRRGDRCVANVRTETPHGVNDNNKHNTLLKSIDAGR